MEEKSENGMEGRKGGSKIRKRREGNKEATKNKNRMKEKKSSAAEQVADRRGEPALPEALVSYRHREVRSFL